MTEREKKEEIVRNNLKKLEKKVVIELCLQYMWECHNLGTEIENLKKELEKEKNKNEM